MELGGGDQSRIRDLKNPGKAVAVVSLVSTAALSEQGPTHRGMTSYPSVQANWNGVEISQMSSHFYFTALFRHLLGGTILCSQEVFRLDSCAPSCCCCCCCCEKSTFPLSMPAFKLERKHLLISFILSR